MPDGKHPLTSPYLQPLRGPQKESGGDPSDDSVLFIPYLSPLSVLPSDPSLSLFGGKRHIYDAVGTPHWPLARLGHFDIGMDSCKRGLERNVQMPRKGDDRGGVL